MHITVLGAGVTGLTTAWYLARDGHQVEVVERNQGVALEASFANGAQLSYSYVAPLAGPGVLPKVPPWLLRRDAPLRFYPALDLQQWRWLLEFVLACNRGTSDLTTRRLLALSFYSRALMHQFVSEENIDFGYVRNGKLVLFSTGADFDGARRLLDFQRSLGCEQNALDRTQCIALEPLLGDPLSALGSRFVGGIHTVSEEVGDCYRFCQGLEIRLREMGVTFRFDTRVTRLETRGNRVTAIDTPAGSLPTDLCVMTLGAHSPILARPLGIRLPIYPLKGYSVTLPPQPGITALGISITDAMRKVVYAPLAGADGNSLRVAGMADIAGYSSEIEAVRVKQLFIEAERAFPAAADYTQGPDAMQPWAGLRPATPKGTPILGASPYDNLYLNSGHGALGWTLALGSARILADLIKGTVPEVPLDGFTLRG
ncbi:MAG: D-amino acid dehydrogenase [Burkholderiaceae bacterium]|nr:D-amino acid dehydrogenase [Sulfuritalea sp.]MCF8175270.1 D-amino acid dehydrogenase [Burkholderiaceae bacterium]